MKDCFILFYVAVWFLTFYRADHLTVHKTPGPIYQGFSIIPFPNEIKVQSTRQREGRKRISFEELCITRYE